MDRQSAQPETGFICPECRNSFASADHLQAHYEEVHSGSGQTGSSNGTGEHHSLRSKLAAFVPGIKNAEPVHLDNVARDADYTSNDFSVVCDLADLEEGTNSADECQHVETVEALRAEVRRLSMENEALKRHVQDAEGKCDTMKTCLADMESSNQMLQSQLALYKAEVNLMTDQIALRTRRVPVHDVLVGPDEVPAKAEDPENHVKSVQWFYDTMASYFSHFDSLKSQFSESAVRDQPEYECPVPLQNCSSIPVRELASFLISEFDFLRAKCRMLMVKDGYTPTDEASLDGLCEDDPRRAVYGNLEKENKVLQEQLRSITASADRKDQELQEANARFDRLKKELGAINEEKSRFARQVEQLTKMKETQEGKTELMQMELRTMESVKAELQRSKAEQTIAIGKMEEELSRVSMERDDHKAEVTRLLAALDMATQNQVSQRRDWESERHRLKVDLKQATERIVHLESNLDSVKEKCQEHELALRQQLDTMTDQVVELRKEASENRSLVDKLEQERSVACDRYAALTDEVEGAKRETKAAVRRFEDLEADYSNKVYEYDELQRKYDEVLGALQEIGMQHSHLQVDVNRFLTRRWIDDATVTSCNCGKKFSVTVRKHHCRNCGSIFCNECSNKSAMVASSKRPVRVCSACFEKLSVR